MPEVSRFYGIIVRIFYDDHNPPHFHAEYGEHEVLLNINTLDPGRTLENATNNIDHVTYDALVTFEGEDLKTIRPSLATQWTMSPDGLTYTFTLRPNVKFASGNPMTAADFKWSFERLMNIKGNGAWLLDGDGSAIHNFRGVAEVQIWQARLRKERHIDSHGHDAARQRSDRHGAVVVGWI